MPVERSAQPILLLLYLARRGRPKVRLHGRPRSDRKRRFLLSAVAPSTGIRHPREARPINWAQRGGLALGRENISLTPRPHFAAPSCTLGNQVFCVGRPSFSSGAPSDSCNAKLPGPVAVCCRSEHSASYVIVSWVVTAPWHAFDTGRRAAGGDMHGGETCYLAGCLPEPDFGPPAVWSVSAFK